MQNHKITAIVVLYNPNFEKLILNLNKLINQINFLVLIDNSDKNLKESFNINLNFSNYIYHYNNTNIGIAKAQNIGISISENISTDFYLFLDQDSCPSENMLNILIQDYLSLINKGINIAGIGPTAMNIFNNIPYYPRFRKFKVFSENMNVFNVSELISSGMLVEKNKFNLVGNFEEKLFIDGVDHEWCWRAISKNFVLGLSKKCHLQHALGEGDRKLFGFRVAISSSFRIYYQYRNFIYLSKKSYVPFYWKLNNFIKYAIKYFYYPIFISFDYFKQINKGIIDGFKLK